MSESPSGRRPCSPAPAKELTDRTRQPRRRLRARAAPPDLVERDFTVEGPDRLWVADFTQLTTWQGTAYVAVVADAYSRLCLGWSVRGDKMVELVLEALDMAIWRRGQMRSAGAIHHGDQGSQPEFKRSSQHGRFMYRIVVGGPMVVDGMGVDGAPVISEAA